jgi:hypothetical protein
MVPLQTATLWPDIGLPLEQLLARQEGQRAQPHAR